MTISSIDPYPGQLRQAFFGTHHLHWFTGLLTQVAGVTADEASRSVFHGGSVAAHLSHVAQCLKVVNETPSRPLSTVNWTEGWANARVSEAQWQVLLARVRVEVEELEQEVQSGAWLMHSDQDADTLWSQVLHAAYHAGAVAQILKYEQWIASNAG